MNIRLIIYAVFTCILVGCGLYVHHLYVVSQEVPRLRKELAAEIAGREQERKQAEQALARENEIQKKLAATVADRDHIASRLRRAYQIKLPSPAPSAPVPDGTPGAGGGADEIDDAVTEVIGACKRDSIRLQEWQRWYESLK